MNFIRYALATISFAASVGCLAWWGSTFGDHQAFVGPGVIKPSNYWIVQAQDGYAIATAGHAFGHPFTKFRRTHEQGYRQFLPPARDVRSFGLRGNSIRIPLWYPALVFALASVAALSFRRQFSIRSALTAVGVATVLLGVLVAL